MEEEIICKCMNVSKHEILDAIKKGDDTVQEIMDRTGAGTGCGKCVEEIEVIIKENC